MEYSANFEKIKSYYDGGLWTEQQVADAVSRGKITATELQEIVGVEDNLELIRNAKIAEISNACSTTITTGVDVEIGERTDHFNLELTDQSNINNLFRVVELGGTEYPYQADDGTCIVYSATEIVAIYIAAQSHITTQTAYHNALKLYVQSLDNVEDISSVVYGMELPEPYAAALNEKLSVAAQQMEAIIARLGG